MNGLSNAFFLRRFKPKHVFILFLFYICVYYLLTKEHPQACFQDTVFQFEWPIYWRYFLMKSQKLQIILLDDDALKCIYSKNYKKKKECGVLYSKRFLRFGTVSSNFSNFIDVLKKEVIENSNGSLEIQGLYPPDTIVLLYNSSDNYVKQIIISFISFPPKNNKNYHLLHGNYIAPTIAVRTFKIIILNHGGMEIMVPEDVDRYLYFYKNGVFHECNATLAQKSENFTHNIPSTVAKPLSELVDIFIESGQTPFMAWGTLLGWYRDCGIIKHTQDIDFHILADEYVDRFEETFINHSKFPIRRRIGKREYGLEFTLWIKYSEAKNTSVDFFYLYENDAKTQWSGCIDLMTNARYKSVMPKLEGLCSADLYDFLFFIPCNYIDVIISNYGYWWDFLQEENKWAHTYEDGKWNHGAVTNF